MGRKKHWLTSKLRLSINPNIINKNQSGNDKWFADGWQNCELTPQQIATEVGRGVAYCAELSGPRKTANFRASGILSVDIDGTRSLQDAVQDPFIRSHATIIYTTQSHSDAENRFRLIFALDTPIEDAADMRAATRSLALRLSGDPKVEDPARIFFGSEGCLINVYANGIDDDLARELIEQSSDSQSDSPSASRSATTRSGLVFPANLTIRGVKLTGLIEDHAVRDRVFCPFHHDTNPSAFVLANQARTAKGIHCSACARTFWPSRVAERYDFSRFDKAVHAAADHSATAADRGPFFETADTIPGLQQAKIVLLNERFVSDSIQFDTGLTLIKSPKGSGKTEFLAKKLAQHSGSVLLIGHRRSLIRQLCSRLGLHCYLDDFAMGHSFKRYGVCLDSIGSVPTERAYDLVVIDESEQVLAHLLSDTLKEDRQHVFHKFCQQLRRARFVVALDADLGWITASQLPLLAARPSDTSLKIVLNEHKIERGNLNLYASKAHLLGEMLQRVQSGNRVFVTSNSKRFIDEQETGLIEAGLEPSQIMKVTSETSQTKRVQSFIEAIQTEAKNYAAVLTSPSLSTGVDISFEAEEAVFDVFGFFEPKITTHFEIDQQISRVRQPKSVSVYVSPQRFRFETDPSVVQEDLLEQSLFDHLFLGYADDNRETYNRADPFLRFASVVVAEQRASKNDLRRNFSDMKSIQGWTVKEIEKDWDLYLDGVSFQRSSKELTTDAHVAALMAAIPLTKSEFDDVKDRMDGGGTVRTAELVAFQRTGLELFYRAPISDALIRGDNYGKLRRCVSLFQQTFLDRKHQETPAPLVDIKAPGVAVLKHDLLKSLIIRSALQAAGILGEGRFIADKVLSTGDLMPLVTFVREHKPQIESQLDIAVRSDFRTKPVLMLSAFLRLVGLGLTRVRTTRKNSAKKAYFYKLNAQALKRVEEIVHRREGFPNAWAFFERLHGFGESPTAAGET